MIRLTVIKYCAQNRLIRIKNFLWLTNEWMIHLVRELFFHPSENAEQLNWIKKRSWRWLLTLHILCNTIYYFYWFPIQQKCRVPHTWFIYVPYDITPYISPYLLYDISFILHPYWFAGILYHQKRGTAQFQTTFNSHWISKSTFIDMKREYFN